MPKKDPEFLSNHSLKEKINTWGRRGVSFFGQVNSIVQMINMLYDMRSPTCLAMKSSYDLDMP